jgi:hypothetical protein
VRLCLFTELPDLALAGNAYQAWEFLTASEAEKRHIPSFSKFGSEGSHSGFVASFVLSPVDVAAIA